MGQALRVVLHLRGPILDRSEFERECFLQARHEDFPTWWTSHRQQTHFPEYMGTVGAAVESGVPAARAILG